MVAFSTSRNRKIKVFWYFQGPVALNNVNVLEKLFHTYKHMFKGKDGKTTSMPINVVLVYFLLGETLLKSHFGMDFLL